ncbi:MAG: flagellar motor switch protein FliG, partial [Desulfovibrio sp.]
EELEFMGPTYISGVESAQQNIVKIVRRLEAENKVVVSRGGGDIFV